MKPDPALVPSSSQTRWRRGPSMHLKLELRPQPSRLMAWLSPLVAAAATLVAGFTLFSLLGKDALQAFEVFFVKPIETRYGLGELLLKASPLMLCAIGLAAGYRANVWNIGAEGQLTLGALCGGGVALAFPGAQSAWILLPMMCSPALPGAWRGRQFRHGSRLASTPTKF